MSVVALSIMNQIVPYSCYPMAMKQGISVTTAAILSGAGPLYASLLKLLAGWRWLTCGHHHHRGGTSTVRAIQMREAAPADGALSPAPYDGGGEEEDHEARSATRTLTAGRGPLRWQSGLIDDKRDVFGLVIGFIGVTLVVALTTHGLPHQHGKGQGAAAAEASATSVVLGLVLLAAALLSKASAAVFAEAKVTPHFHFLTLAWLQTTIGSAIAWTLALAVESPLETLMQLLSFGGDDSSEGDDRHFDTLAPPAMPCGTPTNSSSSSSNTALCRVDLDHQDAEDYLGVWVSLLYLGVAASSLVYLCQFLLIGQVGAVKSMVVDYITPVVGAVEGGVLAGRSAQWGGVYVTVGQVAGLVLILLGVALMRWTAPCRQPEQSGNRDEHRGGTNGVGEESLQPLRQQAG